MYEEKDYIMRLVHELVRTLIKLIFHIDIDKQEEDVVAPELRARDRKLKRLVDDGDINQAENKLLDGLNPQDRKDFVLALMFYEYLNKKEDEFLETHGFSRDEIVDGIKYVVNLYGCGSMVEAFLEDF